LISVTAFVDWNAQIYNCAADSIGDVVARAQHTLERTARLIAKVLTAQDKNGRFHVTLRLYHGWYKGFEPTPNRRAIVSVVAATDFATLSRSSAVVFSENVQYGDLLLGALPTRQLPRLAIHLPNTLRQQDGRQGLVEKMVDTALAADLLCWARNDPDEWAIILADDDDLVPPIFVAEAWTRSNGGRIFLIRHRHSRNFMRLDGLVIDLNA
jgi:hypothetical protein